MNRHRRINAHRSSQQSDCTYPCRSGPKRQKPSYHPRQLRTLEYRCFYKNARHAIYISETDPGVSRIEGSPMGLLLRCRPRPEKFPFEDFKPSISVDNLLVYQLCL